MRGPGIFWISAADPPHAFPDIAHALTEPNGLLAAGGDLSTERLIFAYRHGIFPWYEQGQPILWWSPDPRCVLRAGDFRVSKRLARSLRTSGFRLAFNQRFAETVAGCALPRPGQQGTWITDDLAAAMRQMHASGWAHSVEVLHDDRLVGGLYGLAIGRMFFGESMFSLESNASKAALLAVCTMTAQSGFPLLDCQVESAHLMSLGASRMPRSEFRRVLERACYPASRFAGWPSSPIEVRDLLENAGTSDD